MHALLLLAGDGIGPEVMAEVERVIALRGENDVPDRLVLPERLYGRKAEVAQLLAAFERVAAGGSRELVLVSGHAGIGKSALVHELDRALAARSLRRRGAQRDRLPACRSGGGRDCGCVAGRH